VAAEAPRRRRRIVSIVGTRPEAIKMAPVVRALAARPGIEQQLVLTGQHAGLADFFEDVAPPVLHTLRYDPRGRTAPRLRESLHAALGRHLRWESADLVLVHGDTATAMAGALAAFECGLAIGHVEAGLRSFDLEQPWPEEGNRTVIDVLAELLFAPTEAAARNLSADWRVGGNIHVTGNTGIDQLFHARDRTAAADEPCARSDRRLIVATCHRKENQGAPMRAVCAALQRLTDILPLEVVVPLHLNPHVRGAMMQLLADRPLIRLVEPLEHGAMVRLMARSWLILTDSGGLQEEGAALGKPVLVLREVTERPEGVETANLMLVGTDETRIVDAVAALFGAPERYARMSRPSLAFGDGKAAPRIVALIERWLRGADASRRRASAGRSAVPAPPAPPPAAR
jgi:UDP-N-acetylglucosamine 2-epimerase (non-hydrolysing)